MYVTSFYKILNTVSDMDLVSDPDLISDPDLVSDPDSHGFWLSVSWILNRMQLQGKWQKDFLNTSYQ